MHRWLLIVLLGLLTACGTPADSAEFVATATATHRATAPLVLKNNAASLWQPAPGISWQIQYPGPLDTSLDVAVYNVDGFDISAQTVAALHTQGRRVVCYINVGAWEDWRPDAADFPAAILGNDYDGWPGERWLDIRRIDLLGPILEQRLEMCRAKGFDGVDPDNLDGYQQDSGFPITQADQETFLHWLAAAAHSRGLAIGLKNVPELIPTVGADFQWSLTEDCFDQGWCDQTLPFIAAGKAVFAVEYTDTGITTNDFCAQAAQWQISAVLKHRNLDAWIERCP